MSAPLFGSATDAAGLIRRGQLTATELVQAQLDRIRAANPAVNALVEVQAERALAAAAEADRAVRTGAATGDLHGVPISVKEAFQVTGFRSTWGNPAWADARADRDATVVRRLRDAGVIGKKEFERKKAELLARL
jgi:amidase